MCNIAASHLKINTNTNHKLKRTRKSQIFVRVHLSSISIDRIMLLGIYHRSGCLSTFNVNDFSKKKPRIPVCARKVLLVTHFTPYGTATEIYYQYLFDYHITILLSQATMLHKKNRLCRKWEELL